jgi:hypothetical protein
MRLGVILALVAVVAAACGGGSSTPSGRLHVRVAIDASQQACAADSRLVCVRHRATYSLNCDPVGGTMPNPAAACSAIDDLVTHHRRPRFCSIILPQGGGNESTASITGTFTGRPFRLRLTNESWCGEPDPVMRDFWVLSTFPCSTVVYHYDNSGGTYADWADKSGCTTDSLSIVRQG